MPNPEPNPRKLEQKPKSTSETYDPISEDSDDYPESEESTSETHDPISEDSDDYPESEESTSETHDPISESSDDYPKSEESYDDKTYRERSRKLSCYDAIPRPRRSKLLGANPVEPLVITKRNRPKLIRLSKIALNYYKNKEGSGASFEFHNLVKSTFWFDCYPCAPILPCDNGCDRDYRPKPTY